jgi:hypothetical protein
MTRRKQDRDGGPQRLIDTFENETVAISLVTQV